MQSFANTDKKAQFQNEVIKQTPCNLVWAGHPRLRLDPAGCFLRSCVSFAASIVRARLLRLIVCLLRVAIDCLQLAGQLAGQAGLNGNQIIVDVGLSFHRFLPFDGPSLLAVVARASSVAVPLLPVADSIGSRALLAQTMCDSVCSILVSFGRR